LTTPKDSASIALVDRDLWTEIDQKNAEYHSKNEGNPFIDHRQFIFFLSTRMFLTLFFVTRLFYLTKVFLVHSLKI
jgi:hypothetical protein